MTETPERVGVATVRKYGAAVMYHRVTVKLTRKYRVWWVPGDTRSVLMDPVEFADKFVIQAEQKVKPR